MCLDQMWNVILILYIGSQIDIQYQNALVNIHEKYKKLFIFTKLFLTMHKNM